VSGSAAITEWIAAGDDLKHPVLLVSGVKTDDDVMRGEETQLTGLFQLLQIEKTKKHLFILPGTHSKHIIVDNANITDFKTYMTGEMFALISKQSILSNSVIANKTSDLNEEQRSGFLLGVQASIENNLLHALFTVRTNQLFKKLTPEANYFYLSGLIIGSEISSVSKEVDRVVIAGEGSLIALYELALQKFPLQNQPEIIPGNIIESALIAGHFELLITHVLKEKN
jgi:2-dehydro-3-deoxygalactonokinase